jgi:hypothetical protein
VEAIGLGRLISLGVGHGAPKTNQRHTGANEVL